MKAIKMFLVLIATASFFAGVTYGAGGDDCKSKWTAKQTARDALFQCLSVWEKKVSPSDSNPSDNCASKLTVYENAATVAKACKAAALKQP